MARGLLASVDLSNLEGPVRSEAVPPIWLILDTRAADGATTGRKELLPDVVLVSLAYAERLTPRRDRDGMSGVVVCTPGENSGSWSGPIPSVDSAGTATEPRTPLLLMDVGVAVVGMVLSRIGLTYPGRGTSPQDGAEGDTRQELCREIPPSVGPTTPDVSGERRRDGVNYPGSKLRAGSGYTRGSLHSEVVVEQVTVR